MGGTDRSEHRDVARVLGALADRGVTPPVRHLDDAVRTAQAAADALGVTPGEIANSLVFAGENAAGALAPVLVLTSGDHRVDPPKVAAELGLIRLRRATPEQVREWTGFAIGGVAPLGHLTAPTVVVDRALDRFEAVWAAAGHSHSVFQTSYAQLVDLTGGAPLDVA